MSLREKIRALLVERDTAIDAGVATLSVAETIDCILALTVPRAKALNFYEAGEGVWESEHYSAISPCYRIITGEIATGPRCFALMMGGRELSRHPSFEAAQAAAEAHWQQAYHEAGE